MKLLAGSALFLAAAAGFAQQMPDKKVTLDIPAGPINKALDMISKEISVPLLLDRSLQKEIVVAHVADCPAGELMVKLADSVAGRWSQEGQGWRLLPDAGKRNAQAKVENDARAKSILDTLKEMEKAPDFGKRKPDQAELKQAQDMFIATKAKASIIRSIGVNNLASILPGGRVVFSTRPTAMQRALSVTPDSILALTNYHNLYEVSDESIESEGFPPDLSSEMTEMMKFFQNRMRRNSAKITVPPAKVVVVAEHSNASAFMSIGQGVQVKLRAYAQDGKVVLEEDILNSGFGMFAAEAVSAPAGIEDEEPPVNQQEPPVKEDKTPKLEFSERAKLILKSQTGGMGMFGDPEQMTANSDKLGKYFLKPYDLDPLELVHGEALRTYASMKKVNLVACLPDDLMVQGELNENTTVQAMDEFLNDSEIMSSSTTEGWIVAGPAKAETARRQRLDRLSLQGILTNVQGKPEVPLDEIANFAFNNPNANESTLLMAYIPFGLKGMVISSLFEPVNWGMMRFYGSLPVAQRNLAKQSGRITISELGPDARAALNQMVFGASSVNFESGTPVEPPAMIKDNPMLERMMSGGFMFLTQSHSSFLDEPTEFLPNGLNGAGFIQIKGTQSPVLSPIDAKGKTNPLVTSMDIGELAFVQTMTSASSEGWMPDLSRFLIGNRTKMEFTFHLRPDVRFKQQLQDDQYSDKKIYAAGQLPNDIDKQLSEKKEKMKSLTSMFGGMGGFGGGNVKPPTH